MPSGGWQVWHEVSSAVTGDTGVQDLLLKFTGGAGALFTVDSWKFE